MLPRILKNVALRALTLPFLTPRYRGSMRNRATIFMLHRFRSPELGNSGHDPGVLRGLLNYLRANQYALLPLDELFSGLRGNGDPLERAVAFTLDDGYVDQATVAAPIFREYDCPVTTFVTTGFLDGALWQWWDQIEFIFQNTPHRTLGISLGERELVYTLGSGGERVHAALHFVEHCKTADHEQRALGIAALSQRAEVDLPASPPPRYAPMSWSQLRECEERGMSFGAHTVSHPLLSQLSKSESRDEIGHAWERLGTQARQPMPIFCYPNGRTCDFGIREIEILRELGLHGALTAEAGHATVHAFGRDEDAPFQVPRLPFSDQLDRLIFMVSGGERIAELFRRR